MLVYSWTKQGIINVDKFTFYYSLEIRWVECFEHISSWMMSITYCSNEAMFYVNFILTHLFEDINAQKPCLRGQADGNDSFFTVLTNYLKFSIIMPKIQFLIRHIFSNLSDGTSTVPSFSFCQKQRMESTWVA